MVNGDSLRTPLPADHIDLAHGSVVLRAAIYDNWFDKKTGSLKYQAFMLAPKDGDFLSVYEKDRCHPSRVQDHFDDPIYAVAECPYADVVTVRAHHSDLLLRVCRSQTEEAQGDAHASIYGLSRKPAPPTPVDHHSIKNARKLAEIFRALPKSEWRPS